MATSKLIQNDGDTVTWKFRVSNTSNFNCSGVKVVFTIPTGILLTGPLSSNGVSISVPIGSYNPTNTTWFIGNLSSGSTTGYVEWEFTVDDISQASELDNSFIVSALVSSRCDDSNDIDNLLELMLTVGEECYEINLSVGNLNSNIIDTSNLQITV